MGNEIEFQLTLPLPHAEGDEAYRRQVERELMDEEFKLSVRVISPYPICDSWAMIAFGVPVLWLLEPVRDRYMRKILQALEASAKKAFRQFSLCIQVGGKEGGCRISLDDVPAAMRALRGAFFEISVGLRDEQSTIYWPDRTTVQADGELWIHTSRWHPSRGSALLMLKPGTPDHSFFTWITVEKRIDSPLVDADIERLRAEFNETKSTQAASEARSIVPPKHAEV